jgi:5'/3'-nucleotidase
MKILVTNDDGIQAPGLWALAEQLAAVGEVVVFAPAQEQSGVGTAISLRRSVGLSTVEPKLAGVPAFAVDGTPCDSVILALEVMKDIGLVVSGINTGANMGCDVLLSGTVGAALQGYIHGIPSVAVSVQARQDFHFEVAARVARLLVQSIARDGAMPILLNVNVPNLPHHEIKGIELTRVGKGGFSTAVTMGRDGSWDKYKISIGKPWWSGDVGTDIHAVENARISITPLQGELGTAERIPFPEDLPHALFREL